jgi:glutathione S-transferase
MHNPLMPVLGHGPPNMDRFTNGLKECKKLAKVLDNHLNGRKWFVGDDMTIADLYLGSSMMLAF